MMRTAGSSLGIRAAIAAAVVLALGGCSATDDGESDEEAGAIAAAQAYVDAIAALDVEAVDAMTDAEAFEFAAGPDDDVDIREALPDAVDPISDPWVSLIGPKDDPGDGQTEYVIDVSYAVKGLTGGGTMAVALEEDADPTEAESWTVTEPLIVRGETYADEQTVPTGRIGTVELTYDSTSHRGVWGYPGGYLLEPAKASRDVDPLWVAVGAADAPPWNDSLPMLESRGQE
jgi:hypothetical protein